MSLIDQIRDGFSAVASDIAHLYRRLPHPTLDDLLARTASSPVGSILSTAEGFSYYVVSTGGHLTTAGGLRLQCIPTQGTFNVLAFGAKGNGVNDDTGAARLAVAAAATHGKAVVFPAGIYLLRGSLTATAPVTIAGDGMGQTVLSWTADASTTGISIVAGASTAATTVRNLTLRTFKNGQGMALAIDYSGNIVNGMVQPRTAPRVRVENVYCHGGDTVVNSGWLYHIELVSVLAAHIVGCHVEGRGSGGSFVSETAFRLRGDGSPCEVIVERCAAYQVRVAVMANGYEGVFVNECNFVAVGIGVHFSSTAQEPQLQVHDNHMNVYLYGVLISQCVQFNVHDNLFYSREDPNFTGNVTGVHVDVNSSSGFITNNVFARQGNSNLIGVQVHGPYGYVHDNKFLRCVTGIIFNSASGSNRGNRFEACTTEIIDSGTNTKHDYLSFYAKSLDDIGTANPGEFVHRLVAGATGIPTGAAADGSHVRTLAWDGNRAWQHYFDGTSSRQWTRRKAGGTWGPWLGVQLLA